jgi:NMD protein affecting ribosome stability and mRNA decay
MLFHVITKKPTRKYVNGTFERRHRQGLCIHCGKAPPVGGHALCEACRERSRARMQARKITLRAEGTCQQCGERQVSEGSRSLCVECRTDLASWIVAARQAAVEHGRCTRCRTRPHAPDLLQCEKCCSERLEYYYQAKEKKNANTSAS